MKKQIITLLILVFVLGTYAQKANEVKGLSIGTMAPLFNSPDEQEQQFSLEKALENGPVVLFFYRGVWCPFCNRHLSKIQEDLPKLIEKGVTVVAITPEKPEYIEEMTEKTHATFKIVYDKDYSIANAYGVNFKPDQNKIDLYNKRLDANFSDSHETEDPNLPIPATYIITKDGKIWWRHFDPNYKKRAGVAEILKNLP